MTRDDVEIVEKENRVSRLFFNSTTISFATDSTKVVGATS